jgi:hypothetical protein
MAIERTNSSRSTLDQLPSERHDPLLEHMRNADAAALENGDLADLEREQSGYEEKPEEGENGDYDLESQTTMGKSLTRKDTAAWVTKHPSRIPDDGISPPLTLSNL